MFFNLSLIIALVIFGLGLIYRVSGWFRYSIGPVSERIPALKRFAAAIRGILSTVFSAKIGTLLKVFFLDILLQLRTLRESTFRWIMHLCIFGGFMLLLLMHGLGNLISANLFENYSPTLNPFLFLRDLFGIMVIVGLVLAVYRRRKLGGHRLVTKFKDHYAIMILAVIMVSGFLLEAAKIGSYSTYQDMVEQYADTDDKTELKSLESYWVENFGLVAPNTSGPFDESTLSQGKEIHELSCEGCHSRPQWAPVSYGLARIFRPIEAAADRAGLPAILLYIHFLSCFVGLAYLPFSKMFHLLVSPLSLLSNAVMDRENSDPANIATRQVMELDACTHCGTCTLFCSVGASFNEIPNENILPSEKIAAVRDLAAGKKLSELELKRLLDGLYICTNCYRCTEVCPVGINLQDLWVNLRERLFQDGCAELFVFSPLSLYRGLKRGEIAPEEAYQNSLNLAKEVIDDKFKSLDMYDKVIDLSSLDKRFARDLASSQEANSFSYCFTCMTCSSACPVVMNYDKPREALGLLPHQIMKSIKIGLSEPVFRSGMLWNCLGCYQCQDHCPQGVRVTDILYELKNLAVRRFNGKATKS